MLRGQSYERLCSVRIVLREQTRPVNGLIAIDTLVNVVQGGTSLGPNGRSIFFL